MVLVVIHWCCLVLLPDLIQYLRRFFQVPEFFFVLVVCYQLETRPTAGITIPESPRTQTVFGAVVL